ncbi:MAG: cobyrinic acid a,c-diamide synthase [Nitrospirae bacterium GWF2_44_13]|nr:MAG: cobyrinic acid a,c-diamide synthase [Nitrospirae bacterium GWF2_44_13]OGW65376.1 MAG: cobyrinic acid a,c-diamide synthase [Nitrospirae bacterium RIFOXYA2_FULL_44_9]
MKMKYPRIIVAGLKGGSGKTTLSLGLIAAFRKKGMKVIPFKKGPDYIDGGWLSTAAGTPCYNLDTFLVSESRIIPSFMNHAKTADIAVIEGNRGFYDGMDEQGTHSTAELAKMLKSPVLLIVDCTKATRTIAAIIAGIQKFDSGVEIKGVVLNYIAGSRHEFIIRNSIEKYCKIPVLGAFPRMREENFPERHMGLVPFQEHIGAQKAIDKALEITEEYIDVDAILKIAKEAEPMTNTIHDTRCRIQDEGNRASCIMHHASSGLKIGVIRDSAFQFYYPENFEELKALGAEIIEISALKEKSLPDIDALYIGGGFPETHAIALAENSDFRDSLRKAIEKGLSVYAECGGLMYLGKSLVVDGRTYPMTEIFPFIFSLEKKPQAHGYSIAEVRKANPFYPEGAVLKGHEFHYSRVINPEAASEFNAGNISFAFGMKRGEGITDKLDGLCYKNVLATYTHTHALGTPEWTSGMIKKAEEYKRQR